MLCYLCNCKTGLEVGIVCCALDVFVKVFRLFDVNSILNIMPFKQGASSGMKAELLI